MIHHTGITDTQQLAKVNESHRRQGYPLSEYGYYVAYQFFIGTDGTLIETRGIGDIVPHTSNQSTQQDSISIVFAGNFEHQKPSEAQLQTFKDLYRLLYKQYNIEFVEGHDHTKATACPGFHIEEALKDIFNPEPVTTFQVSRYYTPVPNQLQYYRDTYEQDFKVNCHGDCLSTANGYKLSEKDAFKVAACPPDYPFGTKLEIEGYGEIVCVDRGGAIKGNRIDVWAGIGEQGLRNIYSTTGGLRNGKILQD